MANHLPPPRWYGIPFRVLLLTILGTLLAFAVSTLAGIFGLVLYAGVRGIRPDMTVAYRVIALPVAVIAGAVALIAATVAEVRHYRQTKALAGIERLHDPVHQS